MEALLTHRACHSADSSSESKADIKKNSKPVMEKRRRAKINTCLDDLKALILSALHKDPARHSKLEKADILEMTVRHLQQVQRQQLAVAVTLDPTVLTKFKSGFSECAQEVDRYMGRIDGVESGVQKRMQCHLDGCVSNLQQMSPLSFAAMASPTTPLQMAARPPHPTPHPADPNNNSGNAAAQQRIILTSLQSLLASRLLTTSADQHRRPQPLEHRPQPLEHRPQPLEHRAQPLEHGPQPLEHRQPLEHCPHSLEHRQPLEHRPQPIENRPQPLEQTDRHPSAFQRVLPALHVRESAVLRPIPVSAGFRLPKRTLTAVCTEMPPAKRHTAWSEVNNEVSDTYNQHNASTSDIYNRQDSSTGEVNCSVTSSSRNTSDLSIDRADEVASTVNDNDAGSVNSSSHDDMWRPW